MSGWIEDRAQLNASEGGQKITLAENNPVYSIRFMDIILDTLGCTCKFAYA